MYQERNIIEAIKYVFVVLLPKPSQEELDELAEALDWSAVAQAVRDHAQIVYAYETSGDYERAFTYRSKELFSQRATRLFESSNYFGSDLVVTTHTTELWLLEDMTVKVVSCVGVRVTDDGGSFLAEYRTLKGELDADFDIGFLPEDLAKELFELCEPQIELEAPFYEM